MAIEQEYQSALAANEQRYAQAMAIYDEIIKRYQPGGTFGKAALGQLEAQKTRDVGKETQQMISSGLYGTTTTAGLPTKWEAEVGAPSRLRLEDIMMERLSQAQIGKAGFIERREDVYPDVGAYAGYAAQAATAPTFTRTTGGTYGASSFPDMFSISGARPTTGTGGAVYGSGTQEATQAEIERRRAAAATVSPSTRALAGATTYEQAAGAAGQQTIKGEDVSGWTEAEKKAYANYVPGVSGYNVAARKAQQKGQ